MNKERANQVATVTIEHYKVMFKNSNKGAFLQLCKKVKNSTLKDQIVWLSQYCEKNQINFTIIQ